MRTANSIHWYLRLHVRRRLTSVLSKALFETPIIQKETACWKQSGMQMSATYVPRSLR